MLIASARPAGTNIPPPPHPLHQKSRSFSLSLFCLILLPILVSDQASSSPVETPYEKIPPTTCPKQSVLADCHPIDHRLQQPNRRCHLTPHPAPRLRKWNLDIGSALQSPSDFPATRSFGPAERHQNPRAPHYLVVTCPPGSRNISTKHHLSATTTASEDNPTTFQLTYRVIFKTTQRLSSCKDTNQKFSFFRFTARPSTYRRP